MPNKYTKHPITIEERFWSKVDKNGPIVIRGANWPANAPTPPGTPCWLWTGATAMGYGQININRTHVPAHHWPYEQKHGAIPKGLESDHLCRTPLCVRDDHLEIVTHAENYRRGTGTNGAAVQLAKARCPRGHSYDETNTYRRSDGRRGRMCRACGRARSRANRIRSKALA